MFPLKSLRAKALLWALIPTVLVLVAVAIIALFEYERVSREVVEGRDTELARVSAARLAEGLSRYNLLLQRISAEDDVQSLEPGRMNSALEKAENQLSVFDAGVVVYSTQRVALWSQPFAAELLGKDIPVPSEFDKVRRTLRPAFSNVFRDAISGDDVILVRVPIVGRDNEFKGVLAGMFTIRYSLVGATYAEVLEFKAGRTGFAYLVDGNGLVIYHQDGSRVGSSLAATVPVARATSGETGALVTQDSSGETVISGFAPVPGTDWGLITQERWETVIGTIRARSRVLLGLLVAGGVLSAALIFIGIGRILKPVKDLTLGARRIAGGDLDYTITARTSDEIHVLAQQFNTMASALKESYGGLEHQVAERTAELRESEERLRTVITGAPIVLFALDSKGMFTFSDGRSLSALGLKPGEVVGQSIFDVYRDMPQVVENVSRALACEEFTSTVEVGELVFGTEYSSFLDEKGEVVGVIGVANDVTERKQAEETLRDSEERYRTLFEESSDPIFIGYQGKVVAANQAMLDLFGFTSEEAIGSDVGNRFVDPEDRERFRQEIAQTGSVKDFETKLRKKDGTEMDCLMTLTRRQPSDDSSIEDVEGIIRDVTERKQAEETLLDLAVMEERNRMAREIHDTLAQGFTGIVLQLEAAEQASEGSPSEVPDHLSRAKNLARESLQEARRSVWNLLPRALDQRSLEAALDEELRRFSAAGRETASFNVSGDTRDLPSNVQAALLRICQESLTNIRCHAEATQVTVDLSFYSDAVSLGVQDNGKGFDSTEVRALGRESGFGLTGMEQRVRLLNGTFDVASEKGNGTLVRVKIPTD